MPKIPPLKGKAILVALLKHGFYKHHQTGSHIQLRHMDKLHLRVTVPRHDKFELPPFVVGSIIKQAEITKEEFLKILKEK
ncbi:MAG: type II toxin-antitoxin system HicA family toxin [Patescibacteria group bacterium]